MKELELLRGNTISTVKSFKELKIRQGQECTRILNEMLPGFESPKNLENDILWQNYDVNE